MKKFIQPLCRKISSIFSLGIKKYDYFLEAQFMIDECMELGRSKAEIEDLAKKNFRSARVNFILLILSLAIPIITYLSWFIFFRTATPNDTFSFIEAFKGLDDVWIEFMGSVIGSAVTVLGVYISIKYDSRQQRKLKLQQSQPILMPETSKREHEENALKTNTDFQADEFDESKENMEIPISFLAIRNIGFNTAVNISLSFSIKGHELKCVSPIELLMKEELTEISGKIKIEKSTFLDILCKEIYFYNYPTANQNKSFKYIVGKVHSYLNLIYFDVYENETIKKIPITIHFLKKEDDSYVAIIAMNTHRRELYKFLKKNI